MSEESTPSRGEDQGRARDIKKPGVIQVTLGRLVRGFKKHKTVSIVTIVIIVALAVAAVLVLQHKKPETKAPTAVAAEYERQLPDLKKAVDEKPSDASARKNYAVALYATGNLEESRKQYEESTKLNGDDAIAYNNLGNVYRDLGQADKAVEAYKKSLQQNAKSVNTYVNLANVQLYSKSDSDAAINTYKDGLKALPDNEQLQLLLGVAYEQAGRTNEARQAYEAILAVNGDSVAAQTSLERLKNEQ